MAASDDLFFIQVEISHGRNFRDGCQLQRQKEHQ